MAITYDQMTSTTKKYYDKTITQNIYENQIVLNKILKGGRVKVVTGGRKVFHPIRYKELGQAAFVNPHAARVSTHVETRTALELEWKYCVTNAVMLWDEKLQNRGEPAIVSLIKDKLIEAMQDEKEKVSDNLFQLYASKGTYDLDGLYSIIRASTTSYAGISGSDVSSWVPGLNDTTTTSLSLYGSNSLDAGITACWFRDRPDLIATTRAIASEYASKLQPSERRAPENGKAGATDLAFEGIPFVTDTHILSGDLFILNTDHLWLYVQAGENFQTGAWEKDPALIKSDSCLISFVGNLVCDLRKSQGAFSGMTLA